VWHVIASATSPRTKGALAAAAGPTTLITTLPPCTPNHPLVLSNQHRHTSNHCSQSPAPHSPGGASTSSARSTLINLKPQPQRYPSSTRTSPTRHPTRNTSSVAVPYITPRSSRRHIPLLKRALLHPLSREADVSGLPLGCTIRHPTPLTPPSWRTRLIHPPPPHSPPPTQPHSPIPVFFQHQFLQHNLHNPHQPATPSPPPLLLLCLRRTTPRQSTSPTALASAGAPLRPCPRILARPHSAVPPIPKTGSALALPKTQPATAPATCGLSTTSRNTKEAGLLQTVPPRMGRRRMQMARREVTARRMGSMGMALRAQ